MVSQGRLALTRRKSAPAAYKHLDLTNYEQSEIAFCHREETRQRVDGFRMGRNGIRTLHLIDGIGDVHPPRPSHRDDMGSTPFADCHPGFVGGLPASSLPPDPAGARGGPAGVALLVVSRHLRAQQGVAQPRPRLCLVRTVGVRLPAGPAFFKIRFKSCLQRTHGLGLCQLLSDDCGGDAVLLFL